LIVKKIQERSQDKIEYNFIFAKNNLTFEGRNFDAAVSSDFYDSLYFLVLGDVQTIQAGEEIFKNIEDILSFAVEVSKLSKNYKIYGENQVKDTTSPGEILYEIIQSNERFGKTFDFNCNQECTTVMDSTMQA
jgi:hypothetical protein